MVRVTDETMPVICFQSYGVTTQAQLAEVRPIYDRLYQRKAPFITISDARFADHSAGQRKMWAAWLADGMSRDHYRNASGSVVILDSALLRGAMLALNWVAPPQVPQDIAADWNEAMAQARALAARCNIHVPDTVWGKVHVWLSQGNRYKQG